VILIDQLKEIYIDGTLKAIDTTQWYPTVMRKEYTLAFTVTETGLDDPDQMFYENYFCESERNYTGYCSAEADKLIDQQSVETDAEKRRQIVWQIEKYWPRMAEGRSSSTLAPRPAHIRRSRGSRLGSTALTTMAHGGRLARPLADNVSDRGCTANKQPGGT
jgi:hypothetical protein